MNEIQCQKCKAIVPAEKAFCPNCNNPLEVEEKRKVSREMDAMIATVRLTDDMRQKYMLEAIAAADNASQTAAPKQKPVVQTPPMQTPTTPPPDLPNLLPRETRTTGGRTSALPFVIGGAILLIIVLILILVFLKQT